MRKRDSHPAIRRARGIAVVVFLAGLDMAVPMLDHWHLLEWYARVAEGDTRWWQYFEPYSEIQIHALARLLLTLLRSRTFWTRCVATATP